MAVDESPAQQEDEMQEDAMDELLRKLRTPDTGWSGDAAAVDSEVAEQAARQIERLRDALLAVVYESNGRWFTGRHGDQDVTAEVSAALNPPKQ